MRQHITQELLDDDQGTPREIRESLEDLWRVNRYLGGLRCLKRSLETVLEQTPARSLTVLDVGAGTGDVGAWMHAWLAGQGIEARVCVLDRRLSHLLSGRHLLAASPAASPVHPLVADALALPLPDDSIDIVTCNLFLHHFHGEEAVTFLRSLLRVARHAVVISDLERSLWPWLAIRMVPRPFIRRLSHVDGPASVRKAYSPDELRQLLLQFPGAGRHAILRVWPWRLGAVLWKDQASNPPIVPN